MTESTFSQELAFLVQVQGLEESEIQAKAVIEKLGYEKVQRIDFQCDVIKKDTAWGLSDE